MKHLSNLIAAASVALVLTLNAHASELAATVTPETPVAGESERRTYVIGCVKTGDEVGLIFETITTGLQVLYLDGNTVRVRFGEVLSERSVWLDHCAAMQVLHRVTDRIIEIPAGLNSIQVPLDVEGGRILTISRIAPQKTPSGEQPINPKAWHAYLAKQSW
jgi:hypothetical protein